jgi:hypothetical protein
LIIRKKCIIKSKPTLKRWTPKVLQRAKCELHSVECFNRRQCDKTDAMVQGTDDPRTLRHLNRQMYMKEDKHVFRCKLWFDQNRRIPWFRGYAGKLYGNNIKVGDAVTVLPSLTESKVSKIHFW